MADTKITELTALSETPASTDVLAVVDLSDTTMASSGTTKKVTVDDLISEVAVADMAATAVVLEAEGIGSNDNDTSFPTSAAVKDYVDTQLTAEDLDVTSDSGTIAIDLDSETLTLAGGTGIDTSATSNTVTAAIDSTVTTLTGTQVLTNKTLTSPVLNTGVSGSAVLDSDTMSGASATTLATSESIKAYVDALGDSDTTYTAGTNLTLDGTTFNVDDVFAGKGANSDITSLTGLTTDLSVAQGGTGQSTVQAAIDALTQSSGATTNYVLTRD